MVNLYLENKPDILSIDREEALPALESQIIEVFSKLNSSTEVFILGLIINDSIEVKISPFSKFVWKITIINLLNNKEKQEYYSTQKVMEMIKKIFEDTPFF